MTPLDFAQAFHFLSYVMPGIIGVAGSMRFGVAPVMASQCASCPFREGGDTKLQAAIIARTALQAIQICHHPRLHSKKETHLCRGARDHQLTLLYRIGLLPKPTDKAFAEASAKVLA